MEIDLEQLSTGAGSLVRISVDLMNELAASAGIQRG